MKASVVTLALLLGINTTTVFANCTIAPSHDCHPSAAQTQKHDCCPQSKVKTHKSGVELKAPTHVCLHDRQLSWQSTNSVDVPAVHVALLYKVDLTNKIYYHFDLLHGYATAPPPQIDILFHKVTFLI